MTRSVQRRVLRPPGRSPGLWRVEHVMGVPVTLDIRDRLPGATLDQLARDVFGWLRFVDTLFSTHLPDSEISLLDQGMIRPARADPLVREVLRDCARLNERTEGYFDVHATGWLDPSRYVRGWALQRASTLLTQAGAVNHRLSAGGDQYAAGRPAPSRTWRVNVPDPVRPRATAWVVPATDLAVATTDGRTPDGGRGIYDPRTRRPATGLASVTVTGPDLGTAGAYATAAFAMGHAAQDWLAGLGDEHSYAVIDDRGRRFHGWLSGLVLAAETPSRGTVTALHESA